MSAEKLLQETLALRGSSLNEAPLSLSDVQSRARSIRRRRTACAGVGALAVVAAVAAVAVPVTLSGTSTKSVAPATTGPSPTAKATLNMQEEATIPYVESGTLHMPDGFSYTSKGSPITGVVLVGGHPVVTTTKDGQNTVATTIGDLSSPATAPAVASADGKVAAWVDPDNDAVMMSTASATAPLRFGTVKSGTTDDRAQVVAVTGEDCPRVCTVFVNVTGTASGGDTVSLVGTLASVAGSDSPPRWTPLVPGDAHLESVDDVTGTVAAGTLSVDEFPASDADPLCVADGIVRWSGVVDLQAGSELWRTCSARNLDVSPSGAYAVGTPVESDGLGPRRLLLFDGQGSDLGGLGDDGSTIMDSAWEDDTHLLLAMLYDDGVTWKLMRYDVVSQEMVPLRVLTGKPEDYKTLVLP
ncbi:hypothetical protein [Nocardioides sp. Kera G14]|uniref:hypothetical protein n=1 Tax=Nocardioides sp. Kera G14 TaxID=2884264 RepID=UPI001D12CED8|nr:hypothetical protein [Nocardioides sp. Kera G14]UDY24316.1 hypothetical protein LH076_03170 [Nocardioides sp. Kera G14]